MVRAGLITGVLQGPPGILRAAIGGRFHSATAKEFYFQKLTTAYAAWAPPGTSVLVELYDQGEKFGEYADGVFIVGSPFDTPRECEAGESGCAPLLGTSRGAAPPPSPEAVSPDAVGEPIPTTSTQNVNPDGSGQVRPGASTPGGMDAKGATPNGAPHTANVGIGTVTLPRIRDYLAANGRAASTTGPEYAASYVSSLTVVGACSAILLQTREMAGKVESLEYPLDFSALSPDVEIRPWAGETIKQVWVRGTSGNRDIVVKFRRADFGKAQPRAHTVVLVITDGPTADTVAALFSKAIAGCGGRLQDPAVARAAQQTEDSVLSALTQLTGGALATEERSAIQSTCEAAVRNALRSPSTAEFEVEVTVLSTKAGEWMVMGSVEGQNAYGGRLQKNYACTVQQFGKQYVAASPILY